MELSLFVLLLTVPLVELLLFLPISVGGIGLRETAFSLVLPPFGFTIEEVISFSLLSFALLTVTRILSGLAFLQKYNLNFTSQK